MDAKIKSRGFENKYGFKYREITAQLTEVEQLARVNTLTHNAIFFILEGEMRISGDTFNDVTIRAGELFFLPRGANISGCIVGREVKYIAARLDHDIDNKTELYELLKAAQSRTEQAEYTFSLLPIREPFEQFIQSIKYYIINDFNSQRLFDIKFYELYVLFCKCYTQEECLKLFYPILKSRSKFKNFILDNYHVSVSIDELAAKANMSRSTFDRTFKENFNMTPHKWIDMQTMMLILRKAAEPNVTVKDMMYEVGVYNASQFTQLCKRLCGDVPSRLIHQ